MKKLRISLVIIPILAIGYATALVAAPYQEYYIKYYEDPAKTVQSGWKNQYCWGATWGCDTAVCSNTPYYTKTYGPKCAGGGGCDDPYDPNPCG